jgi:sporulation protein YlmC with PRC-barrel domain
METIEMTHKLKSTVIALVPAIGLTFGLPAFAADTSAAATPATQDHQYSNTFDKRASRLIGADVHNARGENLGEVKDLIVDVNNGRVHYAILSFGGFAGMGDKLFAYPMRSFRPANDRDELVLNVDKSKLDKAPGFESKRWPDWNDNHAYRGQVDSYFGDTVKITPLPDQRLVRASDLMDANVAGADGKEIGEVKDFVIRMSDGTVRYAVVDFDDQWAPDDKLVVVPMKSLRTGHDAEHLTLNLDRKAIGHAPAFGEDQWPNLNDPSYRARVDSYMDANAATAGVDSGSTR